MFKYVLNIFTNLWYVISGAKKADDNLLKEFLKVWEKRIEQRNDPEFNWETMTHPDDIPTNLGDAKRLAQRCNGGGTLEEVWNGFNDEDLKEII